MEEKRNIAYKFRLYPNEQQKILFRKTFGCCRFIWNHMLSDKIFAYKENGKMKQITPAPYKKEFPWLKEVDSLALANVQLHLEHAYKAFFRDPKIGFPKFKAKHSGRQSYTTNAVNGNIRIEENRLRLPKVGSVRIRLHRSIPEEYRLKSVTVSAESNGKYYVSLLYEYCDENQVTENFSAEANILGIDYAMGELAVFSDGIRADYPRYYRQMQKKLAREQRKLSHCQKGSRNYQKQKQRVARCHEKIRHQRNDFLHKLSRSIADQYDAVAVEDLDMKAMSQGLNFGKSVMDNGNGQFRNQIRYKLEQRKKRFVVIDRFYPSSKTCSCCGAVKKDLKLSDRIYICSCGNRMDRDVNTAINIREEGRRMLMAAAG